MRLQMEVSSVKRVLDASGLVVAEEVTLMMPIRSVEPGKPMPSAMLHATIVEELGKLLPGMEVQVELSFAVPQPPTQAA